ncbi:MAG: phage tail protein, partial [Shewanella sp.]|nr:phage tail protein [Shewanella sp.]
MTGKLIPVITTRGLAAVFNAQNDGVSARITHIAFGDHGHIASKDDLSLDNERLRVPVADGERISDHQIHVSALADDEKEFWIKEVGFFLEDGTMLAIWASSEPLAYKSKAIPLLLGFDLALEALPAQSVTVV